MSIHSDIDDFQPATFARTDGGWIIVANGHDDVQKWNGISDGVVDVGIPAPTAAFTGAAGSAGDPSGTYTVYIRWQNQDDGTVSNLKAIAAAVTVSSEEIDLSSLPTSAPPRVTHLQILRHANLDESVLYVEEEIPVGSLSSTDTLALSDDELTNRPAVPFFDASGNSLANRYSQPRTDKPIIVAFQGRMFMAGYAPYRRGHVEVTNSSPTVQGVGTKFTEEMASRFFHVFTHDPNYTISSVDETLQQLTLASNYAGSTSKYALYTIESEAASRNTLYWSEAGLPEAWPAANGVQVGSSDDEITGLMAASTYLYILQRRSIYRLTFSRVPTDGGAFLIGLRGCINQRCFIREAGASYLLDSQGIYRFDTSEQIEPLTPPLDDMFWSESLGLELRVNWEASKYFHAVSDRREKVIRWFIATGVSEFPRHALCFDFIKDQWWLEEYPFPVCASAVASETEDLTVFGGTAKRVWAMRGTLDGPNPAKGSTRIDVASATRCSVTLELDLGEAIPESGVIGYPIEVTRGRGKGQRRIVTEIVDNKIYVDCPWHILPSTTSIVQLGGIVWNWRSRRLHWVRSEQGGSRTIAVHFRPTPTPGQFDVKRIPDFASSPELYDSTDPLFDSEGVKSRTRESYGEHEVFTERGKGRTQIKDYGFRSPHSEDLDTFLLDLSGVTHGDELRISRVEVEGVDTYEQQRDRQR